MAHGDGWSDIDDLLNNSSENNNPQNEEEETNMSQLQWDENGKRFYETGVDKGVIYPINEQGTGYADGVAWNGLTAVNESPSGAEATPLYADNIKYLNLYSAEDFGGTIESYTYPDEFAECNGEKSIATGVRVSQQPRKKFCFCYRTLVGNDTEGNEYGYKIHIVYGAQASPSETANATVNDSPEAITFSHEFTTTPVNVTGEKPTAHIEIDAKAIKSMQGGDAKLAAIEKALYGGAETTEKPHVLMPDEIKAIIVGTNTQSQTPAQQGNG